MCPSHALKPKLSGKRVGQQAFVHCRQKREVVKIPLSNVCISRTLAGPSSCELAESSGELKGYTNVDYQEPPL